jgi:mycothiol synthase
MTDVTVRGATLEDAPGITALLQAVEAVDGGEEHENLEDVEEMLGNPMLDLSRDWLVGVHDDQVVASAELWPRAPADGELDLHVSGRIHPDHRGQGLGTQLLDRMLERAVAYVTERAEDLGEELRPRIRAESISTNAPADELLRTAGFVPSRFKMLMNADLTGDVPPAPEVPEGYALSTWEGADPDEVRAAHNLAFGGFHYGFTPWDAQMWQQWVLTPSLRPAMSLLLRDDSGAIAAYVQTSEYDGVTEATGKREAFVAKVGTVPDHRRRGLAGLLLSIALARYAEEGYAVSTLDVDAENPTGALGIYERAGYRERLRSTLYQLA